MSTIAEKIRQHPELSDRQWLILDYVMLVITRDDRSPSLREISEACGISSTSVTAYNLDRLVERGLLVRIGELNEQRRVRLPVNPWRQLVDDAAGLFDLIEGIPYERIQAQIAGWRSRRAKLMRGSHD